MLTSSHLPPENHLEVVNEIFARESSAFILAGLTELISKDSSIVDSVGIANRSLLQMAILKNLPEVVEFLIHTKKELIRRKDRAGQNAFHTTIAHNKDNEILDILLKHDKEASYEPDKDGKLPLHYAVTLDNLAAVEKLPKDRGVIYKEDEKGQSPCLLAEDKPLIYSTLNMHTLSTDPLNVTKIFPASVGRELNLEAKEKIDVAFNFLKLFTKDKHFIRLSDSAVWNMRSAASSLASPHSDGSASKTLTLKPSHESLSRLVRKNNSGVVTANGIEATLESSVSSAEASVVLEQEALVEANLAAVQNYLKNAGDPNAKGSLGRPLVLWAFIFASQPKKNKEAEREEIFFQLLRVADINTEDNHGQCLLDKKYIDDHKSEKIRLLKLAQQKFSTEIDKLFKQHQMVLNNLNLEFEASLINAGLDEHVVAETREMPHAKIKLTKHKKNVKTWEEILWNICSLQKLSEQDNIPAKGFPKSYITSLVQSLLSWMTAEEVIKVINKLYPHFSPQQRLVANFIVKEIVFWCSDYRFVGSKEFNLFKKLNEVLFLMHAKKWHQIFESMIHRKKALEESPLVKNYYSITTFLNSPTCSLYHDSFDTLLEHAIKRPSNTNIAKVAHELRCLMLNVLGSIDVSEFYHTNWSKSETSHLAPNIGKQTFFSNQLTSYISQKISFFSEEKAVKFIRLLVLVVLHLSKDNHIVGIETNTALAIISALSSPIIARHKLLNHLDAEEKQLFEELDRLYSAAHNFEWLRQFISATAHGNPHLGLFLRDITLAMEGNPEFTGQALLIGNYLKRFLLEQRELKGIFCQPKTNIANLLKKNFLCAEELYTRSLEKLPFTVSLSDKMSVQDIKESLKDYLDKKILFRVNFNNMNYEPDEAVDGVASCLHAIKPKLSKKELKQAITLINELNELLELKKGRKQRAATPFPGKKENPLFGVETLKIFTGAVHKRSTVKFLPATINTENDSSSASSKHESPKLPSSPRFKDKLLMFKRPENNPSEQKKTIALKELPKPPQ